MNIQPLRDLVLVSLDGLPVAPAGIIEVVRLEQGTTCFARVCAIGPEVRDTRVGQRVAVSRLQGIEVGDCVLLPEGAILAHIADDTP